MTHDLFDATIDAEYMPSQRVPGAAAIFDAWVRDSAALREHHPPQELAYGPGLHERMDVFSPDRPRGTVVFIHGGYWQAFYKDHFSYLAGPLLDAGCRVVIPSYDLAPHVSLARIVEQLRQATALAARTSSGPLCVTGHSAGGHLAAMMHATNWAAHGLPHVEISGGIGISGLYDLSPLKHTQLQPDLKFTEQDVLELSPIHLRPRQTSPFVVAVGELESASFHAQAHQLTHAWPGLASAPIVLAGRHHFNAPDDLLSMTQTLLP